MIFQQKWYGRNCSEGEDAFFPATVPGSIQEDYGIAHGFSDVQYADGFRQYLPLEDDHWEYCTVLNYEKKENESVFFVSGGIDYRYDISLNGEVLYSYEGMFRPVELDLTEKLTSGENRLTVHIYPHPKSGRGNKGTRDEANSSCKPMVCYGMDWNPRLLVSGIWDETYIETRDEAWIGHAEALAALNNEMDEGCVTFSYDCKLPCEISLYDRNGTSVGKREGNRITVLNPELWWCNGQGDPVLYRWVVSNGKEERSGQIGFRKLRLLKNLGTDDPYGFPKSRYEAPATVELNGRRIFIKGSNWVNPELFWGKANEQTFLTLLTYAKNANMNLLRAWGGAGPMKNSFFEICDRFGILVWQEFMLACNRYPDEAHYLAVLESEARAIILRLRRHPSLALWCGGNELFNTWSGMDDQSKPLRLLNKLCYELDQDRPFLPTSPVTGMAHGGYLFFLPKQNGEIFHEYQNSFMMAYPEFGVPSMAKPEILRRIIPEEELFPPRNTAAWEAHHAYNAWGKNTWICDDIMESYFGKPDTLEEMVERSEWLQSAGYQGAFEEMRRQWPHCSMAINWCFNEPWMTAANNSLLSYPAIPKKAYSAVAASLRPVIFSARIEKFSWNAGEIFEAELWLLNDAPKPCHGKTSVILQVGEWKKELGEFELSAEPNRNRQGATVREILPEVAGCDRLKLILQSDGDSSSEYVLQYKIPKKKARSMWLNGM